MAKRERQFAKINHQNAQKPARIPPTSIPVSATTGKAGCLRMCERLETVQPVGRTSVTAAISTGTLATYRNGERDRPGRYVRRLAECS
jgi:hypothetical protein